MLTLNKQLKQIAYSYNIKLLTSSNYPYCSYILANTVFNQQQTARQWWEVETDVDTILIPDIESDYTAGKTVNVLLGFFHELGHILDARQGVQFKIELDRERSAWVTGLRLFNKTGYNNVVSKEEIHKRVSYCLSTYM